LVVLAGYTGVSAFLLYNTSWVSASMTIAARALMATLRASLACALGMNANIRLHAMTERANRISQFLHRRLRVALIGTL
jgi:hypothetical protein